MDLLMVSQQDDVDVILCLLFAFCLGSGFSVLFSG
jgi:hypothetical protein